jgi:predicted transcriptional regulator
VFQEQSVSSSHWLAGCRRGEKNMKRSNLEIIIDILKVCKDETKKTSIIYKTNLNFLVTEKYLKILVNKKWVEKTENAYRITSEGRIFLDKAKEVSLPVEPN